MRYDYIEIGTSDFATLLESSPEKARGLSVEPIAAYLSNLPDRPGKTKVNCAISNQEGTLEIFYIPAETITKLGLDDWLRGCNSVGKYHPMGIKACEERGLDPAEVYVSETVPVLTFAALARDYEVDRVEYLKVDTEGHDAIVLRSYFDYCRDHPKALAYTIRYESNYLTPSEELEAIAKEAIGLGYQLTTSGEDTYLQRTSVPYFFRCQVPGTLLRTAKRVARRCLPGTVHRWLRERYLRVVDR